MSQRRVPIQQTSVDAAPRGRDHRVVKAVVGTLALAAVAGLPAGCSSAGLPDPFRSGVPHDAVVIDRVDCDPTPDLCTRYVVLRPVGISTNELVGTATDRMQKVLGWKPTRYPEVVEYDEGAGFDGPKKHSPGGMINTVSEELHYWSRVGYTTGSPPPTTLLDVARAMRAATGGVIVTISGG